MYKNKIRRQLPDEGKNQDDAVALPAASVSGPKSHKRQTLRISNFAKDQAKL